MWTPMAASLASAALPELLAPLRWTAEAARPHTARHGFRARPHARQPCHTLAGDREVGAGADQNFFQAADEFDCAQCLAFAVGRGETAQVEDGIADDLARAVESDVAAAVALEKLDAALGEEFGRCDYVRRFRIAA